MVSAMQMSQEDNASAATIVLNIISNNSQSSLLAYQKQKSTHSLTIFKGHLI